jgi:2-polyprenyl-3-methyl-5-hydroxy-6-metoxy-1,4-benzoquinol methylase
MECLICGNTGKMQEYSVKEMMLGLRTSFIYSLCPECNALLLADIPEDMDKYYPETYYSFSEGYDKSFGIKKNLKMLRDKYILTGQGFTGHLLSLLFPDHSLDCFKGLESSARILDVGCGSGKLLRRLRDAGFTNLAGIDPFIRGNIFIDSNIVVQKQTIMDVTGEWDMIVYNHSLEHINDPLNELIKVSQLLSEKGSCIIRLPVTGSLAWDLYGTDWVQIDAPRHLFIPSKEAVGIMARKARLIVTNVTFDSTAFQFWGSEQYKMDIPLNSPSSFSSSPGNSSFSRRKIREFAKSAKDLNRQGRGDQAVFTLIKRKIS